MIVWRGGERPVKAQTMVDLLFKSGVLKEAVKAGHYRWGHAANMKYMKDKNDEFDIVAYRIN